MAEPWPGFSRHGSLFYGERMGEVVQSLRRSRGGRVRVDIVFAGGRVLKVSAATASRLKVGQELDEAELAGLRQADEVETVHQHALRLLARRPRSERELRDDLRRRRVPEAVQSEVFSRLQTGGWMDDAAFAAAWVENRRAFRPRSAIGLTVELRRKGVGSELIEAALAGHDEAAAAQAALQKAARRWNAASWEEFRPRASAYLARQGFAYDVLSEAVRQVWRAVSRDQGEASP